MSARRKSGFIVRWYPRRDCKKCEGTGWILTNCNGERVATRCDCWWKWTNEPRAARKAREMRDAKQAAAGDNANDG
jgi:hypothetical protein